MELSRRHKLAPLFVMVAWAAILAARTVLAAGPSLPPSPGVQPAPVPRIPGGLAGDEGARISTRLDKCVIRVGDEIEYSLSVEVPPGWNVTMAHPGAQLGRFLIRDYSFPDEREEEKNWTESIGQTLAKISGASGLAGGVRRDFRFTITSYETGDLDIPPLPIVVAGPDGVPHYLFAESAKVRVAPVTNPEDLTIKDIKPPMEIPINYKPYLAWLLVPILIIAAAIFALWRLRRPAEADLELPDLRPAHVIALEELSELEKDDLIASGEFERFYTRLSWILRKYVALRFGVFALEYTTGEICSVLSRMELTLSGHEKIKELLEESDQVKFARAEPGIEERNSAIERTRRIVEETMERIEDEGRAAA